MHSFEYNALMIRNEAICKNCGEKILEGRITDPAWLGNDDWHWTHDDEDSSCDEAEPAESE